MSNLATKLPFQRAMHQFAGSKVLDGLQLEGKSFPASVVSVEGWIVTAKFEIQSDTYTLPNVTVPVVSSQYDYLPLQPGDPGLLLSANLRLGGLSELGSGTAKITTPGNLSCLVFLPFGKKSYTAPSDPKVRVVQGPDGVTIQTLDGTTTTITLTKTDVIITRGNGVLTVNDTEVQMKRGGNTVTVNSSGVDIEGTLTINGHQYLNHEHSGVSTGSSNSGPVVP